MAGRPDPNISSGNRRRGAVASIDSPDRYLVLGLSRLAWAGIAGLTVLGVVETLFVGTIAYVAVANPSTPSPTAAAEDSKHSTPTPRSTPTPILDAVPATGCGSPTAHVYSPDRLQLLAACTRVTGTIDTIRAEPDGDLHVLLKLDAGQEHYINAKNVSGERGDLVLEPVCEKPVTQPDAIAACSGYVNSTVVPPAGTHTAVTGAWVLDKDHGWLEIHPVASFTPDVAVSPTPSSTAAPTPTPAPVTTPTSVPAPAPPPPASLSITITAATYGNVAAHTLPGATCSARARLPSGDYSQAQGLQAQPTAGADGNVSWTYRTTSRTTPGTGTYFVTCSLNGQSASASAPFTV
jgi:hypothetical protein